MNTANLLALVMRKRNLPSYRQIGLEMGVSGGTVANWARDFSIPTDQHIVELCRLAGEDPAEWIVSIRFNQAHPQARTAWAKIYTAITESNRVPLT